MPALHNIERSGFRRGEYVGYGGGRSWRVRKNSGYSRTRWAWYASAQSGARDCVWARSLTEMSAKLAKMGSE
mgnify:CR=1 FL=1